MTKINLDSWKEFKITDLFNVHGSKTTPKLKLEEYGVGEYPYVTTQARNNGVAGFYDFWTENKNVLTIDSAVIGFCSYQDKEFSASDHVEILEPLQNTILNKYTAMFLKTVICCSKYKYDYGRKFNQDRIKETILLLPAKLSLIKKYEPDWQYMENYIKNLESKIQFKQIYTKNETKKSKIDISKWGEFSFLDKRLWTNIKRGERLIEKDRIQGDIEYYSASQKNNSLTDKISNPLFIKNNCIVYNTFAFAFYVEGEFTASDEIQCFHNPQLNKYNALFIITIMNKNRYKYQFGRKAFLNKLKTETIKLPITQKGLPDWQYMENYIKSLPYADLI